MTPMKTETRGLWLGLQGVGTITLAGTWPTRPEHTVAPAVWLALLYTGVFSMWAGFFAWFRGLSLGELLRVSQMQWLQPFISIVATVPLLGESLDAMTLGFALLVVLTVFMGRRMAHAPQTPTANNSRSKT